MFRTLSLHCYNLNAFHVRCGIASDKIDRVSELAMIKGRLDKIAYNEARLQSAELSHSLSLCLCLDQRRTP